MDKHSKKRSLEIATGDTPNFKRRVSPRWASAHELTPSLSILTNSFSNSFNSCDSNIDMLEGGSARQVLGDDLLSPIMNVRKWQKCYVVRKNKVEFKMYMEQSKRILMTARKIGQTIYLSCYNDFPEGVGDAPLEGAGIKLGTDRGTKYNMDAVCALLRLNAKRKRYTLFSRSCELCDGVLSRFTCGTESPINGDRQLLAEIEHEVVHIQRAGTVCRRIAVELPFVHPRDKSRVVWCPRSGTPRDKARKQSLVALGMPDAQPIRVKRSDSGSDVLRQIVKKTTPKNSSEKKRSSIWDEICSSGDSGRSNDKDANSRDNEVDAPPSQQNQSKNNNTWQDDKHKNRLLLMSKLPKWNDRVESFCMSFHGQRIKVASSKNFVFGTNQGKTTEAKNSPVLQFGKQTDNGKRFALDFRYPMAPVQAFAIFLTACNWCGPKEKD